MSLLLPFLFFCIAWIYAMAGFGGGSTYIALLAVSGLPLAALPPLALICNLIVTAQGSILNLRQPDIDRRPILGLLFGSVPAAFIGGAWRLPEQTFLGVLAAALTFAGVALLWQKKPQNDDTSARSPALLILVLTGSLLGLLAGITGIGGGIYLAPVMHLLHWARPHSITACTSLFIACNSFAGLVGHWVKGWNPITEIPLLLLIACPLAVLIGGFLGSQLLIHRLSAKWIKTVTACIILLVACRLWVELIFTEI